MSPALLDGPCLLLAGTDSEREGRVLLRVQGAGELPPDLRLAVAIEFDNATNPLMAAMPDEVCASLLDGPSLRSTAQALLCEATGDRCGRAGALNRLAEVMVLMMLREAIEAGREPAGIFAALAIPDCIGRWSRCTTCLPGPGRSKTSPHWRRCRAPTS